MGANGEKKRSAASTTNLPINWHFNGSYTLTNHILGENALLLQLLHNYGVTQNFSRTSRYAIISLTAGGKAQPSDTAERSQ